MGWISKSAIAVEVESVEVIGERQSADFGIERSWGDQVPLHLRPSSTSVLTGPSLALWQAARLEDLTGLVPGMVVEPLNAGLSTSVKVRGFALSRLHFDGLPDIQRMFVRDMSTVEQVEVLRGPAALLYGITSPGGVVNYVGKRPSPTPHHVLSLSAGSDGYARAVIDSTGPIGQADSEFSYRTVLSAQDGNTAIADLPQSRQQGLVALTWAYSKDGHLTLTWQDQLNQTPFTFGTVITNAGAAGSPVSAAQVQYGRQYVKPGGLPSARRYRSTSLDWDQRVDANLRLAAQLSQANVSRDEELLGYWTVVSPSTLSGYYTRYRDDYNQLGLRVTAQTSFEAGSWTHSLVAGSDNYHQRFHFVGVQNIGGFMLDVASPDFSTVVPRALTSTRRYNDEHIDEQAVWVADRIAIDPMTTLALGLRDQSYAIASDRSGAGLKTVGAATATTWQAALTRALSSRWQTYAALSTGMEANRGATHSGQFLDPQRSKQFETGVDWRLDGATGMRAAAYQIDLSNLSMTDPLDRTAVVSSGERRVRGIEWSGQAHWGPWQLAANMSALRTQQLVKTSPSLGDEFVGMPRHTVGIQVQRDLGAISNLDSCAVWLGLTGVGPRMGNASNTVRVVGYARLDGGMRAKWPGGHSVQLGFRNLDNLRYVEAVTAIDDVFQGPLRQFWMSYSIER